MSWHIAAVRFVRDGSVGRTYESAPTIFVNLMAHNGLICIEPQHDHSCDDNNFLITPEAVSYSLFSRPSKSTLTTKVGGPGRIMITL